MSNHSEINIESYLKDFSSTIHNIYGTLLVIQTAIENTNYRLKELEKINIKLDNINYLMRNNNEKY